MEIASENTLSIVLLEKKFDKIKFDCGHDLLNNYLKKLVKQDVKRKLSVCYVLVDANRVIGYYTLSTSSIPKNSFDQELAKKLPPSYTKLPVILLGRLAVDTGYKGKRYGELLLLDAVKNSLKVSKTIGVLAVFVDPIDESAERFYMKYGFKLLKGTGKMFIAMKTIEDLITQS